MLFRAGSSCARLLTRPSWKIEKATFSLAGKDENLSTLVVDTSTVINLHASGHGKAILSALPAEVIVPDVVARELEKETSRSTGESDFVNYLARCGLITIVRSEEHTSELQSLMRISYAVFCLKKKKKK